MSDSLADQGDALLAALTGAVGKGYHVEYERDDRAVEPEPGVHEAAVDPLQGRAQIWTGGKPSGGDLEGQLHEALGLGPSMVLKSNRR